MINRLTRGKYVLVVNDTSFTRVPNVVVRIAFPIPAVVKRLVTFEVKIRKFRITYCDVINLEGL
jgi:hypothetical protein